MVHELLPSSPTGDLAQQIERARARRKGEVQTVTDRLCIEPERESRRRASKRRVKRCQRRRELRDVLRRAAVDHIDVARQARRSMHGRGDAPYENELDAVLDESPEK